jgi:hypothetical protein
MSQVIDDEWSPDTGFKGEEAVPTFYSPLIISHAAGISLDWETLRTTLAEKHKEAGKWFPEILLRNSSVLFPLRVWNSELKEHREFKAAYFNADAIADAMLFVISNNLVPFPIPTPSLYCMLHAGSHPPVLTSTDLGMSYLVGIFNLSPSSKDSLPFLNSAAMIELVREIGDKESRPLAEAFSENVLKKGKMQRYFSKERDGSAPEWLARVFVKYGIRVLQLLERQMFRLTPLGYVKNESATMAMCSRLADWDEPEVKKLVTEKCLQLMDLVLESGDHFVNPENWPGKMLPPPSREDVANCEVFYYGVNLKYAEFMLWHFQANNRFPVVVPEEKTPVE